MSVLWPKIFLITGVLSLIILVLIVWHYQYYGNAIIVIIIIMSFTIFTSGFIIIRKRKRETKPKPPTNIEASCESMIPSNLSIAQQRGPNVSPLSDDSMVLQQSHFSPQIVSAIIENRDSARDSLIENNDIPPNYEEAKMLPTI